MNASLKGKLVVGFLLVFVAGAMTGSFVGASHAASFSRSAASEDSR